MSEVKTTVPEMLKDIELNSVEHLRFYVLGKIFERPQIVKAMHAGAAAVSKKYDPDGPMGPNYTFGLEPAEAYKDDSNAAPVASLAYSNTDYAEARIELLSGGDTTHMACDNAGYIREVGVITNERAAQLLTDMLKQLGPIRPYDGRTQ